MKRDTRLFESLTKQLLNALSDRTELFIQERPWLIPDEVHVGITEEQRMQNEADIQVLLKRLKSIL